MRAVLILFSGMTIFFLPDIFDTLLRSREPTRVCRVLQSIYSG